jgi:putative transposase
MPAIGASSALQRRKIHTVIKFLAFIGALPPEYADKISRSQRSRYKNHFRHEDYFGHELAKIGEDILGQMRQINASKADRKIISCYLRIACVLRKAFASAKHYASTLKKCHDGLVDILQDFKQIVPVKKMASLLRIDESTVRGWIREVRVKCSGSVINVCRKMHPNQLLEKEVVLMKKLLSDPDKQYWPMVSVYYYALQNNIVSMSLSTWYTYAGLLNIKRPVPVSLKHYGKSVVALFPNEYWHADVTQFVTKNGVLHYIYLVVDNYSKKILSWAVDTKLCKNVRLETFKEALNVAVASYSSITEINLIVDGGSENNNKTIDGFIDALTDVRIHKEQALKTVHFSNAMAEATNRLIKCYYLNHQDIKDTEELIKYTGLAVSDVNCLRPHGRLKGLTPDEAFAGMKPQTERHREQKQIARFRRVEENRGLSCCKVWEW